jgi:choline dehydrogenase-like flavoprotein
MLDAGLSLEQSQQETLSHTMSIPASEWDQKTLASFKRGSEATAEGILLKLAYGSDFPYRDAGQFVASTNEVGIVPSLARGGLSNVWGAAVLPYLPQDTADWPFDIHELAAHYRAVLSLTGLAGTSDDLNKYFPLFIEPHDKLPAGSQVKELLADLHRRRGELNERGVLFGNSRLAVAETNRHGFACAACRMCMYGCPYGLIYNSSDTLLDLSRNPNFCYQPNIIVNTFKECSAGVEVRAYDMKKKEEVIFFAARLLIAAGTLATTRLVLESLGAENQSVSLKDSQYFLLPLLRYRAPRQFDPDEPTHTLAQAFIEILDDAVSGKSIHLQVYGYNELYREAIEHTLRGLFNLSRPVVSEFLKRFLLLQGYLHSDYSHAIETRLLPREGDALTGKLSLKVKENPQTTKTMKQLIKKLRSISALMRARPLSSLLKMGAPGRGFHTGGSFPMRLSPQELESDLLGRPYGCERVHIVDASVFPSITASTITLTAMANAHRIAAAAALL